MVIRRWFAEGAWFSMWLGGIVSLGGSMGATINKLYTTLSVILVFLNNVSDIFICTIPVLLKALVYVLGGAFNTHYTVNICVSISVLSFILITSGRYILVCTLFFNCCPVVGSSIRGVGYEPFVLLTGFLAFGLYVTTTRLISFCTFNVPFFSSNGFSI